MYSSQQGSAIKTFHSPLDKGTESAVEKLWSEMVVTGVSCKPHALHISSRADESDDASQA